MTRYLYGGSPADFTTTARGHIEPNVTVTVWTEQVGGVQVTDLLTFEGTPCASVNSGDAGGPVQFYAEDGMRESLWLDSGRGSRLLIRPVNLPTAEFEIGTVTTGTAGVTLTPDGDDAYTMDLVLPSAGANGVDTAAIQSKAVTAAKIADDTITAAQIAANAVGASELADNAVDTAAIADSAVTSAKIADGTITSTDVAADTFAAFGEVGNLLTANQASGTETLTNTTGFGVFGGHAIAASTWGPGVAPAALLCTFSGTGAGGPAVGAPGGGATAPATIPVTGGAVHTFQVSLRADENAPFTIAIYWYQSNGTTAASTASVDSGQFTSPTTAATFRLTATAPANAAKASVYIRRVSGANGIVWAFNQFSFHRGVAGTWAMPGVPITGQSHIATNGAYVTSGTVAPEGVITAPPLSRYLQTSGAMTATGAMEWVKATGTGSTGWVAGAEADTGWRDISSLLVNDWTGALRVRRVGTSLMFASSGITGSAATNNTFVTLPSGFRPSQLSVLAAENGAFETGIVLCRNYTGTCDIRRSFWTTALSNAIWWAAQIPAESTWPSSLPGVAA